MELTMNELIEQMEDEGFSGFVILEPRYIFDGGISGFDKENNRLIYNYDKLVESIASHYMDIEEIDYSEAYDMAVEWLAYNTIRSLPYMGENRPILIIKDMNGKYIDYENE